MPRVSNPADPKFGRRYGPTLWDKLQDTLDRWLMYAVALWLLFITLPSLDESLVVLTDDGRISYSVHPSGGTVGSCYKTSDGQHYVRTGRGVRKIGKVLGEKLIRRSLIIRRKALARRVVLVVFLLIVVTGLVALRIS